MITCATARCRYLPSLVAGSGKVIGRCHQRHQAMVFRKFLDTVGAEVPTDLDIHLIVDNYATHKTALIRDWVAKRPRFHLHFTSPARPG